MSSYVIDLSLSDNEDETQTLIDEEQDVVFVPPLFVGIQDDNQDNETTIDDHDDDDDDLSIDLLAPVQVQAFDIEAQEDDDDDISDAGDLEPDQQIVDPTERRIELETFIEINQDMVEQATLEQDYDANDDQDTEYEEEQDDEDDDEANLVGFVVPPDHVDEDTDAEEDKIREEQEFKCYRNKRKRRIILDDEEEE